MLKLLNWILKRSCPFAQSICFYKNITFSHRASDLCDCFQGLWFDEDSSFWMLPSMNVDLASSLNKRGISTVQQLLDLPKATFQTVIGNSPASRLNQVWSAPLKWFKFLILLTTFVFATTCPHGGWWQYEASVVWLFRNTATVFYS